MSNSWMMTSLMLSTLVFCALVADGHSSFGKFVANSDIFNDNRRAPSFTGISSDRTHQLFYPESWPKGTVYGSPDSMEDPGNDIWTPLQEDDDSRVVGAAVKREGHQLSIVNPLDVLRQRMVLDMMTRKMIQNQEQIKANEAILKSLGKRSGGGATSRRNNNNNSHRKDYDGPATGQDSSVGEFGV